MKTNRYGIELVGCYLNNITRKSKLSPKDVVDDKLEPGMGKEQDTRANLPKGNMASSWFLWKFAELMLLHRHLFQPVVWQHRESSGAVEGTEAYVAIVSILYFTNSLLGCWSGDWRRLQKFNHDFCVCVCFHHRVWRVSNPPNPALSNTIARLWDYRSLDTYVRRYQHPITYGRRWKVC